MSCKSAFFLSADTTEGHQSWAKARFSSGETGAGAPSTAMRGGRWRYVYRKTKSEARKALRQALKDRDEGISTDGSATVGALLDEWLASVKDAVSLRTWLGYEGIIRVHLKPGVGDKRLDKLSPKDVQGILREKLDAGLSPVRVRRIRLTPKWRWTKP